MFEGFKGFEMFEGLTIESMTNEQRKILANQPIIWRGDISDDCTAEWAGLMLRAEWMDDNYW